MTDEKQVEVELYGIKALLPPGAEPYIVAYALECDPSFHKGDKIERALANYEHWHWPPIARTGFARIMCNLWWDYSNICGDIEDNWKKAAGQERLWIRIIRATERMCGYGEPTKPQETKGMGAPCDEPTN